MGDVSQVSIAEIRRVDNGRIAADILRLPLRAGVYEESASSRRSGHDAEYRAVAEYSVNLVRNLPYRYVQEAERRLDIKKRNHCVQFGSQ